MQSERGASVPGPGSMEIPLAAAEVLRQALVARSVQGGPTSELRAALKRLTSMAQKRGMRAEQLVVVLKHEWSMLPEVRAMGAIDLELSVLEQVVTLCVADVLGRENSAG